MQNNYRLKILLAIASLFISFLVLEIALHILYPKNIEPSDCRKYDQLLKTTFIPNSSCTFRKREWNIKYEINNLGFRDQNYSENKPENTYRILMLGDSFVEGYGVKQGRAFAQLLEDALNNQSGKNIEIISAGIAGWSPLNEYLFLSRYGLKLQPDLIISTINTTDFFDDYNSYQNLKKTNQELLDSERTSGKIQEFSGNLFNPPLLFQESVNDQKTIPLLPSSVKLFLNNNLYSYRVLSKHIKAQFNKAKILQISPPEDRGNIEKDLFAIARERNGSKYAPLYQQLEANILATKRLADKNGIDFMAVLIPHGIMVGEHEWGKGRQEWGFENNKIYPTDPLDNLSSWLKENKVETGNLIGSLTIAAQEQRIYFKYDGHLNEKGNKIVAESLMPLLYIKIR